MSSESSSETILALTREAIRLLAEDRNVVSSALRIALRVARMARRARDVAWLCYELIDPEDRYAAKDIATTLRRAAGVSTDAFCAEMQERYYEERRYIEYPLFRKEQICFMAGTVDELEKGLAAVRETILEQQESDASSYLARAKSLEDEDRHERVLGRIHQRVFSFLTEVEAYYEIGEHITEMFGSYRVRVDRVLSAVAPEILAQFSSVYRRMREGDLEARSQAISSCRRILGAVADHVYPAKAQAAIDSDGVSHDLGQEHYINRLRQFVSESEGRQKSKIVFRAQVGDLETRFGALVGLASKGVHSDVTISEANQCAIQTYLVAGDVLTIFHGDQASENG